MSHNKFHVTQDEPHRWRNIEELVYKDEDGDATFKDVTRRVLFGEDHHDGMEVRYFEVDAGGHTTLEKHEHTHLVIPIKGKGACLVGDEVLRKAKDPFAVDLAGAIDYLMLKVQPLGKKPFLVSWL